MIAYTALFIGHRDFDLSDVPQLALAIEFLIREGYTRFLCGGMGRFDAAAAECTHRLKKRYPHIRLCLVLPFPNCKVDSIDIYDEIIMPDAIKPGLTRVTIPTRNKFMVESSSAAICSVERYKGGAYNALKIALSKGLLIVPL